MRIAFAAALVAAAALLAGACAAAPADDDCAPNIGQFKIGLQTYTFRGHTFEQAVQKAAALGLKYIEAYPGQKFSEATGDAGFDPGCSPEIRAQAKKLLKASGVKLHNFGVVGLSNNEQECRKVFRFAKDMGIEMLISEPEEDAIPLVEKMVRTYNVRVAIHNHPAPSHYNDPATVARVLKGRDPRMGAAPDIGHWRRSGFDAMRSLRLLDGRLLSLHIKDLKESGKRETRDWPLGQGNSNIKGVFNELKRQGFSGTVIIEYEASQPDPTNDVQQCVSYLRSIL